MTEPNVETRRILPKAYPIRADSALRIPDSVMGLLCWSIGDDLQFEVDLSDNSLRLTKAIPVTNNNNGGSIPA